MPNLYESGQSSYTVGRGLQSYLRSAQERRVNYDTLQQMMSGDFKTRALPPGNRDPAEYIVENLINACDGAGNNGHSYREGLRAGLAKNPNIPDTTKLAIDLLL